MSVNYDQIASVTIDIVGAVANEATFDSILLIGPPPKVAPSTPPALVGKYNSLAEVMAAGWVISGDNADSVGIAAALAFGQRRKANTLYIAPIQTVTVEEVTSYENTTATLARALEYPGWYVLCPVGVGDVIDTKTVFPEAQLQSLSTAIEATERMMVYTDISALASGDSPYITGAPTRTVGVYGKETSTQTDASVTKQNMCSNVAFAAMWLSYPAGSETAAFKQITGTKPSKLTTSEIGTLTNLHVNYVAEVGSRNVTMNGVVLSGEWADVVRFRDWLKADMQNRVVNLFLSNPKIPFTDGGISLVEHQMVSSLKAGQDAGGIALDEYDENGTLTAGFQTSVPLASSISSAQKQTRRLTGCKFRARVTGAIHFAEIEGELSFTL